MPLTDYWKNANITMTGSEVSWSVPDKTVSMEINFVTNTGAQGFGTMGFATGYVLAGEARHIFSPLSLNNEQDFANGKLFFTGTAGYVVEITYKVTLY